MAVQPLQGFSIMRSDMAKLLVERGHAGRRKHRAPEKGWGARSRFRTSHPEDGDGWLPPRHQPHFSENLAPLRRYLISQVGRPWDRVHQEISARVDSGNAVQHHILQHLYDLIETRVTEEADGSLWGLGRYGMPQPLTRRWGPRLYVCPRTGLIRQLRPQRPSLPVLHAPAVLPGPDPDREYRHMHGGWFLVTWGFSTDAGGNPARVIIAKRQLGRRELRDLGLHPTP
jgi:hypothetical protein